MQFKLTNQLAENNQNRKEQPIVKKKKTGIGNIPQLQIL
jgi:hypothetical protein